MDNTKWGTQPVPAEYALVPVEPSAEMVDAAQEAYMPFGDMQLAIQLAIAAAPQPVVKGFSLIAASKEASMALSDELEALAKRHGALSYRNRASHGQAPAQAAPAAVAGPSRATKAVQQLGAGDAVFAFASMLTTLPRVVPFGSAAWATPGVELATAFNAANGLSVSLDFPSEIVFPKVDGDLLAVIEKAAAPAAVAGPSDTFRGDTTRLVQSIIALLELDAEGALVPHGIGGHARALLSAAASRLAAAPTTPQAGSQPAGADRHGLPPLPDPDLRDVGTNPEDIKNFLRGYATEYAKAALASSAPADSVLEDAALLTYEQAHAIRQGHEISASDGYFEARPQIDSNDRRKVFQAGFERGWDAARKQGETNEH